MKGDGREARDDAGGSVLKSTMAPESLLRPDRADGGMESIHLSVRSG